MALGLESNIAETAKAFQGNPQALQQRYTQKQDLFDLLALNMIKKQQAAAKNQLLMSQQEMPGTIIEQMENAVTKNESGEANTQTETATGVAGALATKNAQTQSNMNKMAGVASNSAANMKTLAGGGIVGFAAGKEVEGKDAPSMLDDAWSMLKTLGTGLNKKELEAIQDKEGDTGLIKLLKGFGRNLNMLHPYNLSKVVTDNTVVPVAEAVSEFVTKPQYSKEFEPGGPGTSFTPIPGAGKMKPRDQSSLSGIAAVTPEITEKKDDKPVVSGVDSFSADKSGGAPAVGGFDASKYAADDSFNTQVKGGISDLLNSDPKKAVDFAARTPAEQAFMAKMLKERSDMRDNMMNPDKLSNDRLMQTLLGAKGATAGEAFRTSGLAGVNAERNQEKLRRSEFDALNKLYMDEADKSQGIKQKAFEGTQADKKQGVASGSSLTANEQSNALNADKLFATIENNKVANKLKSELNAISAKRVTAQENNTLANVDTALLRDLTNVEKSGASQYLKEYTAKLDSLQFSQQDKAKKKALEQQYKAEYELNLETLRNGISAERDSIKNRLAAKTGGIKSSKFKLGQSNFKSN